MPFADVNGTRLFYQTYGERREGQAPVLLIHGSTVIGAADWGFIAPLLAREYFVIVPDCRGHGQSPNPTMTYSFKEMAADGLALVGALGFERAHVIGHSNGGNVALVALMEFPERVQTAVVQAANAYVSPDLVEKEPRIFDPARVERERPEWKQELIAYHAAANGPDYWRDYLRLCMQEIISQPNYTPDDLSLVERPVLVIQGENDSVNAPARHAQFIVEHIPLAELWIPLDTGHNVHLERTFAWVERVMDFLARRGDLLNERLYRLKRARYRDGRDTVFDLRAEWTPAAGEIVLRGEVLRQEQLEEAKNAVATVATSVATTKEVTNLFVTKKVRVLLTPETSYALVGRGVSDLRREPRLLSERLAQVLLGEAVRVFETRGDWSRVRVESDGYLGWMRTNDLVSSSEAQDAGYVSACNALVTAPLLSGFHADEGEAGEESWRNPAGKLPFGVSVPVVDRREGQSQVRLPDGALWWVDSDGLIPLTERHKPDTAGIAAALSYLSRFVGVPYLWGGRTPFGFDCSGLARTLWLFLGVPIPSDADRQFRAGIAVEGDPRPGDLLFFGDPADAHSHGAERIGRISHVGISLGGARVLHATTASSGVTFNSLDPASPVYRAWLREHLVGVRRYG